MGVGTATMCEASFNLPTASLLFTMFSGHATVPAGWVYGAVNVSFVLLCDVVFFLADSQLLCSLCSTTTR